MNRLTLNDGTQKVECPTCGKYVQTEYGWLLSHKEPESSAFCPSSGIYVGEK